MTSGTNEGEVWEPSDLCDRSQHEVMPARPWDEHEAGETIRSIMRVVEAAWDPTTWWPTHPDEQASTSEPLPIVYCGAAGVVWGLDYLFRQGYRTNIDLSNAARLIRAEVPQAESSMPWYPTSYMVGELGVALVQALLFDDTSARDVVKQRILANLEDRACELFVGTTGSMLAALFMLKKDGSSIWRELLINSFDALWSRWEEKAPGIWLWSQRLYDRPVHSWVGAGHGFAGNVAIMLAAGDLVDASRRKEMKRRATGTVKALAIRSDGRANWPRYFGEESDRPVQWCHGAPGIIASFATVPSDWDPVLNTLLVEAGELIWAAGPLLTIGKGCGICHGAAGNSFALLKLYRRTGDARWLERARVLAMYAIDQMQVQHKYWGRPWYSLWTGDIGVALALQACLAEDDRICSFDVW